MKRSVLGILIIFVLLAGAAGVLSQAEFQKYYYYWITGYVNDAVDGSGIKAEGHRVVFYRDEKSYDDKKVFAVIGTAGVAGQANRYMLNAFAFPELIKPGEKFLMAVERDSKGYGTDPVEVAISGKGYESLPTFTLVPGKVVEAPPVIKEVWFGKRKYQKNLVETDPDFQFVVAKSPLIKVTVAGTANLNPEGLSIALNEGTPNARVYRIQSYEIKSKNFSDSGLLRELTYEHQVPGGDNSLSEDNDGLNIIELRAANVSGVSTAESFKVTVLGGPLRIIGMPVIYPSPFSHVKNPGGLDMQYTLSKDAEIDIFITGADGVVVKRMTCYAGQTSVWGGEGGAAGMNKVHWDGVSDFGYKVGNAIYVVTIVSRDENKVLGDVLLTVVN